MFRSFRHIRLKFFFFKWNRTKQKLQFFQTLTFEAFIKRESHDRHDDPKDGVRPRSRPKVPPKRRCYLHVVHLNYLGRRQMFAKIRYSIGGRDSCTRTGGFANVQVVKCVDYCSAHGSWTPVERSNCTVMLSVRSTSINLTMNWDDGKSRNSL